MDEQREWFLNTESTAGEEAVKRVETTAKALGYDTNFVDKGAAGFERIDCSFEGSSVGKSLPNSIAAPGKSLMKGRVHQCGELHGGFVLRNGRSRLHPDRSAAASTGGETLHQQKGYSWLRLRGWSGFFSIFLS